MASLHALVTKSTEAAAFIDSGGVNHRSGLLARAARRTRGGKLFVSSAHDTYGAADAAREWHAWAREPKQLEILAGSAHGTDMLIEGEPTAGPLLELVLAFLTRAAPPS